MQERDSFAVGLVKFRRRVAELVAPVGIGSPGRAFQDKPGAVVPGDGCVTSIVIAQGLGAFFIFEEMEGGEIRQFKSS